MSAYDLFDTIVTIIPGTLSKSNRNINYNVSSTDKIEHIPAKIGRAKASDASSDKFYINLDYVGTMANGYIIKDEQTLLEYTVEHFDLKPSTVNPEYMYARIRQTTL